MSRWFRVDDGLVDDPKIQQLPDRLFRAVINLWCVTSQCGGKLPSIDHIAFKLRIGQQKAERLLDDLRQLGLIDDDDDGTRPHNWNARQFKSDTADPTAASRSQRYRDKKRDASRVTDRDATVSVTDTRTDTEQIQSRTEDLAPDGASTPVKLYAFEDGVIRLTEKDFSKWQQAYSHLDLRAELLSMSEWLARDHGPNWFHAAKGLLGKRNRDAKTAADAAAQARLLPLGNRLPEGIT